ncbi:MAG: hypothetical protein Q7T44_15410 [Parvibaculum sp.]|nr:hypothetical protein [Parvibaculum sp.]
MSATTNPKRILLAGGYGVVGAQVARLLRARHPDLDIVIGGRRLKEAARLADELGHASGITLDARTDEPLKDINDIDAIGVFIHESDDQLLRAAASRGLAYMDITRGWDALARALGVAVLHDLKAPVLFSSHWMAGGPAIVSRGLADGLTRVTSIDMSILYYAGDKMGPDSASAGEGMSLGFAARVGGAWRRVGPLSDDRLVKFPSGAERRVYRMNMGDMVTPALATGARDVGVRIGFDTGNALGSMRTLIRLGLWDLLMKLPSMSAVAATKPGKGAPHEIVIEVTGEKDGRAIKRRATIIDPQGQSHLTALGAVHALERVAGLGREPLRAGAALPETGFTGDELARLRALYEAHGVVLTLDM